MHITSGSPVLSLTIVDPEQVMGDEKEIISGCPSCGSLYRVPSQFLDKILSCKKCGKPFKLAKRSEKPTKEANREEPFLQERAESIGLEDPSLLLGRLVVKYCCAAEEEVQEALATQARERKSGRARSLGDILVQMGVITKEQLNSVVSVQRLAETRRSDARFGTLAVQNGFVKQEDIDKALLEQSRIFKEKKSIRQIGDILVESGLLTKDQREAILTRQKQINTKAPAAEKPAPQEGGGPAVFEVGVSQDGLSAFISLKKEGARPELDQLKALLAARGICHGVVEDGRLAAFLVEANPGSKPFKAAEGTPQVPGGEMVIRYHFDTDPLKVGTLKDGGYIDFRERGPVPQVEKESLLAEKVWLEPGTPGLTVTGQPIPAQPLKDVKLRIGKGARISEDGMKVFANVDGRPEIRADGRVYVFSDMDIHGNVNLKTGHVDFEGNVVVSGTVESGFRVRGGKLTANEILAAEIETKGDVVVFGGIIGASIRAGGNVRARYIHESHVEALGDVVVEKEVLDSDIDASGACNIRRGSILSSRIQAKKGVEVENIGSEASRPCAFVVGTDERARGEIEKLKKEAAVKVQEKKKLEAQAQELERGSQKINAMIGKLAQEQDRAMVNKRNLTARAAEANKGDASGRDASVEEYLQALDKEIKERDKMLESHLEAQEKMAAQVSGIQQEIRALDEALSLIQDEISSIAEWVQSEKGNAVIKVYGSIHQYTTIKGLYASLILPESQARVRIKEIKAQDPDTKTEEWRMKISRL